MDVRQIVESYNTAIANKRPEAEAMLYQLIEHARKNPSEVYSALGSNRIIDYKASIEDYRSHYAEVLGSEYADELIGSLKSLSDRIASSGKNKLVLFNATYSAGGVAEMMPCMKHILSLFGIELIWQIVRPYSSHFYDITKKMHDIIQGANESLSNEEWMVLKRVGKDNFELFYNLLNSKDVYGVFFEDPQVLGLMENVLFARKNREIKADLRVAYRLHIDVSGIKTHHQGAIDIWNWIKYLIGMLNETEKAMFQPYCVPEEIKDDVRIITEPPGVDPLAPKNMPLGDAEFEQIIAELTEKETRKRPLPINRKSFLIGARLDGWKGLFEAFLAAVDVMKGNPDLNVVLFGNVAPDAPDGFLIYNQIRELLASEQYGGVKDRVFFVNSPRGKEVSALYRLAGINKMPYIACSLKEGYNLMLIEAVMQGALIITSNVGGLKRYEDSGYKWVVKFPDLSDIKDPSHISESLRAELVGLIRESLLNYCKECYSDEFAEGYKRLSEELKKAAYHTSLLAMARDYLKAMLSQ